MKSRSQAFVACNVHTLQILVIVLLTLLLGTSLYHLLSGAPRGGWCRSWEGYAQEESARYVIHVFLMDGCGWCDKFKPEVSVLTSRLSSDPGLHKRFSLKIVNFPTQSDADKQLMKDFSVEGFPSIVLSTSDLSKFWMFHSSEERTAARVLQWAQETVASR